MGMRTILGYGYGSLYYLDIGPKSMVARTTSVNCANLGLTTNQSSSTTLDVWHRRLGHGTLDENSLTYIAGKVTDLQVSDRPTGIGKICGICALGRQNREAQTKRREKPTQLLVIVHSDICGPMQTPGLNGERYLITFTDEKSGRVSISLLVVTRMGCWPHFTHIGPEQRRLVEKKSSASEVMEAGNI